MTQTFARARPAAISEAADVAAEEERGRRVVDLRQAGWITIFSQGDKRYASSFQFLEFFRRIKLIAECAQARE